MAGPETKLVGAVDALGAPVWSHEAEIPHGKSQSGPQEPEAGNAPGKPQAVWWRL